MHENEDTGTGLPLPKTGPGDSVTYIRPLSVSGNTEYGDPLRAWPGPNPGRARVAAAALFCPLANTLNGDCAVCSMRSPEKTSKGKQTNKHRPCTLDTQHGRLKVTHTFLVSPARRRPGALRRDDPSGPRGLHPSTTRAQGPHTSQTEGC